MNRRAIAAGEASPHAPGLVVSDDGFRDASSGAAGDDEAPYVCPGCYAVGAEPCAPDCIDAEIASELDDLDDDYDDTCIADDCTECDCSRCQGDQARWEAWQGWDPAYEGHGDERDHADDEDTGDGEEIPF